MSKMKPCQHCLSEKIGLSRRYRSGNYHIAYYCKQCYCYGPRVLASYDASPSDHRAAEERAAELWNTRLEQTICLED